MTFFWELDSSILVKKYVRLMTVIIEQNLRGFFHVFAFKMPESNHKIFWETDEHLRQPLLWEWQSYKSVPHMGPGWGKKASTRKLCLVPESSWIQTYFHRMIFKKGTFLRAKLIINASFVRKNPRNKLSSP